MSKKTLIVSACTIILLGSAVVAWGTATRGTAGKPSHTTTFTPPQHEYNVKLRSAPNSHGGDLSFVFAD